MDSSKMRKTISLHYGWRYRSADAPEEEWQQAQPLPTTIHLDLLCNGQIPDPFPGMNEKLVQWVGERTWIYQTSFSIPEYLLRNPKCRVAFVAEGLDTFATVTLDGQQIIQSDNMFVSHRADITKQVRAAGGGRGHTVQIMFDNVEEKGEELVRRYPEHNWFTFNSGVTRLAVRKAQYHYVSRSS
jgi:beta-mannosidase